MKYLYLLLLSVVLSACSDSQSQREQKVLEQTVEKEFAAAAPAQAEAVREDLRPENIPYFNEKVDVRLIGKALEKAGARDWEEKEVVWNSRLAAAKNNAEIQSVVAEQISMYRNAEQALSGLSMRTEKGKEVHDKLYRGFKGGALALAQVHKLDLTTVEGQVQMEQLNPEIQQAVVGVVGGMQLWVELMKESGHKLNAEQEAKFEREVKRLEKVWQ